MAQRQHVVPSATDEVNGLAVPETTAARIFSTTRQILDSSAWTVVRFDHNSFDPMRMFDGVSRLRVPQDGLYLVAASASFDHNAAGERAAAISVNGERTIKTETVSAHAGGFTNVAVDAAVDLKAGDSIELRCYQSSGQPLGVMSSSDYSPVLTAVRLSSQEELVPFRFDNAFEASRRTEETIAPGTSVYLRFDQLAPPQANAIGGSGVVITQQGAYLLIARATVLGEAGGYVHGALAVNKAIVIGWTDRWLADATPVDLVLAAVYNLRPGDVVDVRLGSMSVNPATILSASEGQPNLLMWRLR